MTNDRKSTDTAVPGKKPNSESRPVMDHHDAEAGKVIEEELVEGAPVRRKGRHFEHIGDEAKLGLTKQVSPVVWHNINLNGTYSFDFEQNLIDIDEIMRPITGNGGDA